MNWFIVIQERCDYNGRFPTNDFRAYRKYSVWPKVFATAAACNEFMLECFTFNNLFGRKISAAPMSQAQLRSVTYPGERYRRFV